MWTDYYKLSYTLCKILQKYIHLYLLIEDGMNSVTQTILHVILKKTHRDTIIEYFSTFPKLFNIVLYQWTDTYIQTILIKPVKSHLVGI